MERIRETAALLLLTVCAYTDIKERNIYLLPLFMGGGAGVLLTLMGILKSILPAPYNGKLLDTQEAGILMSYLCAPILLGFILIGLAALMKESFGMGDACLCSVIGLCLGIGTSLGIMFAAFLLAGVSGMALILIRKYDRKFSLPFAPFLLAAFFLQRLIPVMKNIP